MSSVFPGTKLLCLFQNPSIYFTGDRSLNKPHQITELWKAWILTVLLLVCCASLPMLLTNISAYYSLSCDEVHFQESLFCLPSVLARGFWSYHPQPCCRCAGSWFLHGGKQPLGWYLHACALTWMPLEGICGRCYPWWETSKCRQMGGNDGDAPFCCLAALFLPVDAGTE